MLCITPSVLDLRDSHVTPRRRLAPSVCRLTIFCNSSEIYHVTGPGA